MHAARLSAQVLEVQKEVAVDAEVVTVTDEAQGVGI